MIAQHIPGMKTEVRNREKSKDEGAALFVKSSSECGSCSSIY